MLEKDVKYTIKRFEEQLKEVDPGAYVKYKKRMGETGTACTFYPCGKLHIEYKIRKGKAYYWVWSKKGEIIKRGIEK